jgi:5,10-methylenetetrahydromethanopterin reductase
MAASGPKAIELAGEIADGILLSVGFHPRIVEAVLHHLAAGARRGGRRLEDLEVMWAVRVGIASSTGEARRQARPTVVHQAFLSARSHWLPCTGLTLPRFDIPPAVRAIYPDLAHARDWEQAIAATSFVPDEVIAQLCETFGLVGTAEHCARRIVEMAPAGVTNLFVQAFQTFVGPAQEMRAFRDEVFPRLTAAGYR